MFMTYLSHFHTPAIICYGPEISLNLSTVCCTSMLSVLDIRIYLYIYRFSI